MSSQAATPVPSAPAKKGGTLSVIAALLLALGGGGYVAYREFAPAEHAAGSAKMPVVPSDPGVIEIEPFILNLADPSGDRYFRLKLSLLIDRKAAVRKAESGLPQVKLRDRVLSVLSKKHASDLTTVEGKEALRAQLLAAVECLLSEPTFFAGSSSAPSGDGEGDDGEGGGAESAPSDAESELPSVHVLDVLFTEFLVQ
ncbi:MAG: flagellar basal body-associated FliL family protein [Planctomycetes bacterium]|nr:flagellar basal body-associated FliL family protein [Planctomycetota bacterium]